MEKKKRNRNAGKSIGTSESAKFFAKNEKSRKNKVKYQKKYNASPEQKKYRAELNRENRRRKTYGNGDNLDVSHKKDGGMTLESYKTNRQRNGKGKRPRLK